MTSRLAGKNVPPTILLVGDSAVEWPQSVDGAGRRGLPPEVGTLGRLGILRELGMKSRGAKKQGL